MARARGHQEEASRWRQLAESISSPRDRAHPFPGASRRPRSALLPGGRWIWGQVRISSAEDGSSTDPCPDRSQGNAQRIASRVGRWGKGAVRSPWNRRVAPSQKRPARGGALRGNTGWRLLGRGQQHPTRRGRASLLRAQSHAAGFRSESTRAPRRRCLTQTELA